MEVKHSFRLGCLANTKLSDAGGGAEETLFFREQKTVSE